MIYTRVLKPAVDIFVGVVLSALTAPLIFLLSIMIRLESPGAPVFVQRRVGKGLRTFKIYKLRTMVQNAEALGPKSTASGDRRITRLGALLRKTSLDELPQFWNLALGQMSLIGPRPDVPENQSMYPLPEYWPTRHSVTPGITGLAQVRGRSSLTVEQRMHYDMQYVKEQSLALDCIILKDTVLAVLGSKGTN